MSSEDAIHAAEVRVAASRLVLGLARFAYKAEKIVLAEKLEAYRDADNALFDAIYDRDALTRPGEPCSYQGAIDEDLLE